MVDKIERTHCHMTAKLQIHHFDFAIDDNIYINVKIMYSVALAIHRGLRLILIHFG